MQQHTPAVSIGSQTAFWATLFAACSCISSMLRVSCTLRLDACACRYFELSSNRRDIWFGEDMSGSGKFRSDWNLAMLQDAVAPTFARLLTYAAEVSCCSQTDRADLAMLIEKGQACSARYLSGWRRRCLAKRGQTSTGGSWLSELLYAGGWSNPCIHFSLPQSVAWAAMGITGGELLSEGDPVCGMLTCSRPSTCQPLC